MNHGRFIVLDGPDGSGKGTQVRLLADALTRDGVIVHVTCEPSTWPIGKLIRSYLTHKETQGVPDWSTMALLFAADRMQHLRYEVLPHLERGEVVISDRYLSSSLAYQTATHPTKTMRELAPWIHMINREARFPDLTILLDVDPEVAIQRRDSRGAPEELFEKLELQKQVRANFRELASGVRSDGASGYPNCVLVDASGSIEDTFMLVCSHVFK